MFNGCAGVPRGVGFGVSEGVGVGVAVGVGVGVGEAAVTVTDPNIPQQAPCGLQK